MQNMTDSSLIVVDTEQVESWSEEVVEIYRATFTQAPYYESDIARFVSRFQGDARREGFRLRIALQEKTGKALGFTYGYLSTEQDNSWRATIMQCLSQEQGVAWFENAFEVVQLAVVPTFQGRGLGKQLLESLLKGLSYRRALLAVNPSAGRALHLYEKMGWVTVAEKVIFSTNRPVEHKIMGLIL